MPLTIFIVCVIAILLAVGIVMQSSNSMPIKLSQVHSYQKNRHKLVLDLLGCSECKDPTYAHTKKFLVYSRDKAGFNNVRLQLETMISLAAIFERTLVLPPPSQISHLKDRYYDLHWLSKQALSNQINFIPYSEFVQLEESRQMRKINLRPEKKQWVHQLKRLQREKAWFIPNLRITHFESYTSSLTLHAQSIAANSIFYGCRIQKHLIEKTAQQLQTIGLKNGAYDALHLRRGDFHTFRTKNMHNDGAHLAKIVQAMFAAVPMRPLIVLHNATQSDMQILNKLKSNYPAKVFFLKEEDRTLEETIVHMMCAVPAFKFCGTVDSTFSLGILQMRAMCAKQGAKLNIEPLFLHSKMKPNTSLNAPGWNRLTSFAHSSNFSQSSRSLSAQGNLIVSNPDIKRHAEFVMCSKFLNLHAASIISQYYANELKAKKLKFKDDQSDRFVAHQDVMGKLVHRLIEQIVKNILQDARLRRTYSYFCGYVRGASLPKHTDREACEWTVSVLLSSTDDWPIFLEGPSQTHELNVPVGGMIAFQGRKYAHFRKPNPHESVFVLLLHFARLKPRMKNSKP